MSQNTFKLACGIKQQAMEIFQLKPLFPPNEQLMLDECGYGAKFCRVALYFYCGDCRYANLILVSIL